MAASSTPAGPESSQEEVVAPGAVVAAGTIQHEELLADPGSFSEVGWRNFLDRLGSTVLALSREDRQTAISLMQEFTEQIEQASQEQNQREDGVEGDRP